MIRGNSDLERHDAQQDQGLTGLVKAELFKVMMASCIERFNQDLGMPSADISQMLKELAAYYETSYSRSSGSAPSVIFLHRWAEA